jgi:6-phosphogluconate dehydrogenase
MRLPSRHHRYGALLAVLVSQTSWRRLVCLCVSIGVAVPVMSSALSYYDGMRC